ncbi:Mob1/phocein [Carpediemonas membranifera]|uniref:Mob1/phocein n=1 Tax=Carpediemonas membranifera TaxID=201153 RepID=A0A8J6AT59_9EUKA|nr:Mob1/phocein [Carpediemonas membranifera]|eukprot:KAG9391745.1 Mob1/phocein [Carpediemonas membranifera]
MMHFKYHRRKIEPMSSEAPPCLLPGTKNADIRTKTVSGPEEIDGSFPIQEYIYNMIENTPLNVEAFIKIPSDLNEKQYLHVWQYENIRAMTDQLSLLISVVQDQCTPHSCPEMRVGQEWVFLCAAHKTPQQCSAIDYMAHTVDATSTVLNSINYFPSRVTIHSKGHKLFASMARRLARVFAHVYHHHREVFEDFEDQTGLCERFLRFMFEHKLLQNEPNSTMLPADFLETRVARRAELM